MIEKVEPPRSEEELIQRAMAFAGMTVGELVDHRGFFVPAHLKIKKGWLGMLLEDVLGATAGSLAEPDFQEIGVELKTIPLRNGDKPKESTYVSMVPLLNDRPRTWRNSEVYKKLKRVLWIPYEACMDGRSLAQCRLGLPILWSPNPEQEACLQQDWQELMDMVNMGELEYIKAHLGTYLQIRPKAANAQARCWGINAAGEKVLTLPRGFYLRPSFTAQILQQ